LIAIHFEAQKGKFPNLLLAKSQQKHGFSPITKQPKCWEALLKEIIA
jgi:hypothetical protein